MTVDNEKMERKYGTRSWNLDPRYRCRVGCGYALRLTMLCAGTDRTAIASDVESALKYPDKSSQGTKALARLLAIKAKLEHDNGEDEKALNDMEKAALEDLPSADRFANRGGVEPEKTASSCTWTETDMNALVQKFPADYRVYLFRGLYYGFFVSFGTDGAHLKLAIKDFDFSSQLNSKSALPHFFKARLTAER